jgi:hypothetical protein
MGMACAFALGDRARSCNFNYNGAVPSRFDQLILRCQAIARQWLVRRQEAQVFLTQSLLRPVG